MAHQGLSQRNGELFNGVVLKGLALTGQQVIKGHRGQDDLFGAEARCPPVFALEVTKKEK